MELLVPRLLPSMPWHLFYLLILTACCASLLPCSVCLDNLYEICQTTGSTCGNMSIKYPFGVGNRGCGLPGLQIDCVHNSSPVIEIDGRSYTILKIYYDNNNFIIFRNVSCRFLDDPINIGSGYADSVFRLESKTMWELNVLKCNKSIEGAIQGQYRQCNASVYYSLSWNNPYAGYSPPECTYMPHVRVEVGEVEWVSSDTQRNKSCSSCQASGGICGYNISNSTAAALFVCYCKDERRTDTCLRHGPDRNKSAVIIIGCSVGGAALAAVALVFYVKRRKRPSGSSTSKVEEFLKEYASEMPMPTRYSQSDLKKMTNNFAEKLGEGGFGVVYKGKLRNGALVAVKLLDRHRHSENQFLNEVATIGRVHHINLVRLLGYCFESFTTALVYEFMLNGSLEKFIFPGKEKGGILRWEQLYSIALGAARGFAYLHQDCDKLIIHFDIKPHNVLLDADFTPKVADFGLAKLCGKENDHISMTGAIGTPGYVAPEVWNRDLGPVTAKSDVYSFGMLLLEIVGERKNIDVQVSRSSRLYFPEWAFKMLESEELQELRFRGGREEEIEAEDEKKARRLMAKVGLWCIQYNYRDRPCMSRVVQMLEGQGDEVGNPPFPFNSSSATPEIIPSSTEEISSIEIKL